jgi:RNA polymerase-binding transcription factor DksA
MNQQLAEENKQKLLAEEKRIRAILSSRGTKDGSGEFPGEYKAKFPEFGEDEGENAGEVADFESNLAITADLEPKLGRVEAALARIEDGTYGKCSQGDEIEEERLRVVPEADTCIKHSK